MKIELTKSEFDLLIQNNLLPNIIDFIDNDDSILISSNLMGFEILLDNLGDLIAEKGIGDDGEINHFGLRIEKIIDKISDTIWG
ncbi:hypothetical protein J2Y38_004842 [Flavobacterium sp. 2755]|uniref:hypothetical protein n=1 Tax=Flavobacterium sp. 2755 TaxID=2817765 RepID=UPI00285C1955|nr:hypothetical protein [Flavobacterium sp. 2755]MDR6764608.1 hypothetical protein [Flavobacterium sp. 2755]